MDGVGLTSLWVAAMRAVETERPDAMISDPLARTLAGERGFEMLERGDPPGALRPPVLAVRTRYFDDVLAASLAGGTRQMVLLAAGMDARAFRLEFPPGAVVFEVDRAEVLAYKASRLGDTPPRCTRVTVPVDLRADWSARLLDAGFERGAPAVWLVEGLLAYLHEADVQRLLAGVTALAAPRAELLFDVSGRAILESPNMQERREFAASLGAPWVFASDHPERLLEPLGWDVTVTEHAVIGSAHGRWPFPVFPRGTPGVPQSFLVRGVRRA